MTAFNRGTFKDTGGEPKESFTCEYRIKLLLNWAKAKLNYCGLMTSKPLKLLFVNNPNYNTVDKWHKMVVSDRRETLMAFYWL